MRQRGGERDMNCDEKRQKYKRDLYKYFYYFSTQSISLFKQ